MNLFGFKEIAELLQTGCVNEIRENIGKIKGIREKLLKCKYWSAIERMTIISWLDGRLDKYKQKELFR